MSSPRQIPGSGSPLAGEEDGRYSSSATTPSPPVIGNSIGRTDPVRPQSMDRLPDNTNSSRRFPDLLGSGFHMPPEVLGQAESRDYVVQQSPPRKSTLADVNFRARKRSQLAVKATQSQAAAAVAAQVASTPNHSAMQVALSSSMFTLITFSGVEVIFSNTASTTLVGVCSRTHLLFQTLNLASETPVVSISSNSSSGLLIVAHEDGTIQTYRPVPTNPGEPIDDDDENFNESSTLPPTAFGKFLWIDCLTINANELFSQPGETVQFHDRRSAKAGQLVDISSSVDHKILVAHRNQLAVFEAGLLPDTAKKIVPPSLRAAAGRLLWTTVLPSNVLTAKMSGDGQALVVVLEDMEEDGSIGARTFIHDMDDGSSATGKLAKPPLERNPSVGVVYKPGPFLKHATPVTRISFRGLGRTTSSTSNVEEQGNDLLLTYCEEDSAVRVFNQNSWKQIMLWAAPPDSRADWIRGSSAFSLGDLESQKKTKISGSRASSRRPSGASSAEVSAGGGINSGLRSARSMGAGSPTTAAGAWIAEITFRDAFPALRLSRLSYMKRGNDDSQPAHFESIAAILPAGSIVAGSVLNSDDMGLSIQGIWPAWNPWLSETTTDDHSDETLRGSAMQFLGLSSVPPPQSQYFGDSYLGGTHSPPTELRIATSHPTTGNIVVMDFPLWGDDDFGAMELGSPIRSVLSLSDAHSLKRDRREQEIGNASIDYDSSRLCARIDPGHRTISLLWRKQGSQSLYSANFLKDDAIIQKSIAEVAAPLTPQSMQDMSTLPVPLALPPLRLPSITSAVNQESIICIKWWPDDSFDGPPLLLAVTRSSTLLLFEIPPPRSVHEPVMPSFDPFNVSSHGSVEEVNNGEGSGSDDENDTVMTRQEYEVDVTPHPDFGLGLRLESPMDGLPAVAGSFKKHPLNRGMLPAEKTGMIVLGDEVLSVNGVSLEHMTFDDIIATVRHVGAEAGPGQPLALRFRPASLDRSRRNSAVVHESFNVHPVESALSGDTDAAINRRSVLGLSPKSQRKQNGHNHEQCDAGSLTSMLVGSSGEGQQEFGRVVAVIREAVSSAEGAGFSSRFLVMPWGKGPGAPSGKKLRGAALVLFGETNRLYAKRLELPLNVDRENARLDDLGFFDIEVVEGSTKPGWTVKIRTIQPLQSKGKSRSFAVADSEGSVRIVFVDILEGRGSDALEASFRHYRIFDLGEDSTRFTINPGSIGLFSTHQRNQENEFRDTIRIWAARADPSSRELKSQDCIKDELFGLDYVSTDIDIVPSDSATAEVVDFMFLKTGFLESFPSLAVFLSSEVIVYQRRGGQARWIPIVRVTYSGVPSSAPHIPMTSNIIVRDPKDAYPHLLPLIQSSLPSFDETHYLLSDWHPQSLLAHLCTDDRGAKIAFLAHVRKTILWLSDLTDKSSLESILSSHAPLLVAPFEAVGGPSLLVNTHVVETSSASENFPSLMSSLSSGQQNNASAKEKDNMKIERLLLALGQPKNFDQQIDSLGRSKEFKLAMARQTLQEGGSEEHSLPLPPVLSCLPPAELRVLWAIVDFTIKAPNYGKLDAQGQLSLTVYSIHKSLKASPNERTTKSGSGSTSPYNMSNMSSFFSRRRHSSQLQEKSKLPPQSASAGCVSALLSEYQGLLIDCVREPGQKLEWTTVRELRMPFWIRSDDKLRQVSEEVGQSLYRESRDILKASIYFLAAGKKRTLRNLAAADSTASGKKFFNFLTGFDFSSERGRSAAEKNAFSLLRKNKYDSAAAFFLLAEPPILKSAVETIASKMGDLDLAFMVARLIGNAQATAGSNPGAFGGVGMGFGGILGGGGGYAGSGAPDISEAQRDGETFQDWKRDLNNVSRELLIDRGVPDSYQDNAFTAVLMLWLGREDEAWHWLSGFLECPDGLFPSFAADVHIKRLHEVTSDAKMSQDPTIAMVNSFVNFSSGPFLLKSMQASTRTRIASTLLVSGSLSRIGVELPALRTLSQNIEPGIFSNPTECELEKPATRTESSISSVDAPTSSIFGNIDSPQVSGLVTSSIFDNFEQAPAVGPTNTGVTSSSIFDSFDIVPPSKPASKASDSWTMGSSIFDSFDAPPRLKPKVPESQTGGAMTSSIFDTFDAPAPPKPKPKSPASGPMGSSIFDSFDAPPRMKPKVLESQTGDAMTSSIFDAFDAPTPPTPKPNSSAGKQRPASIFDSLDSAPRITQVKDATLSGNIQSPFSGDIDRPTASPPGTFFPDAPTVETSVPVPPGPPRMPPSIWREWRDDLFVRTAARRLIRELGSLGARFHIDAFLPVMSPCGTWKSPLIPSSASQVLQFHCDGDQLLKEVKDCLGSVCQTCNIKPDLIVDEALGLLESPSLFHRVCFAVLLHLAVNRADLAEDVIRQTASTMIEKCNLFSFSNDDVAFSRQSIAHLSTLHLRRLAAHLSWQLELCLWMHRGSALPLSGLALNETICAVRIGLLVASWNRDFEVMETMIRHPPDCLVDQDAGRQLWNSLKTISNSVLGEKQVSGTSSGGWEFLVDCRRAEATEMLRPRLTGCFIIRPHPEDHGVFTLSFKTNLVPTGETDDTDEVKSDGELVEKKEQKSGASRPIKRDDVVQHAIIRLSDSGFRCGSFGPFATLMKLLEAVSSSLPFNLRFDKPPTEGVIKDEGTKPSPNSALFRKLGLVEGQRLVPEPFVFGGGKSRLIAGQASATYTGPMDEMNGNTSSMTDVSEKAKDDAERKRRFGMFLEVLVLSEIRKQLSSVAAAKYDSSIWIYDCDADSVGSTSDENDETGPEEEYAVAARIIRPLSVWCRMKEIGIVCHLAPRLKDVAPATAFLPVALKASETAIEISTTEASSGPVGGDAVIRRMIQPGSGVGFRTLRLGDGGDSAMVVLFSKSEAVNWFLNNEVEKSEEDALARLHMMEKSRVIEPVALKLLAPKAYKKSKHESDEEEANSNPDELAKGIRYRLVDPWEVEPLENREAETRGASLGRHQFLAFGLGKVAASCEDVFRSIGGPPALELWAAARGSVSLTKAIATVHPPWERASGGDLQLREGIVAEPVAYDNSIRQHLYRNALFRRLGLPQRYLALIQVELLDLKNLTSPGGSLSLTVYSLLRLKRPRSTAPLTMKARTLDSVATHPTKLGKTTGPNAPASWGSLVRFRFPLPEYTAADGRSYDVDREALFKGPPSVLQVSVYEKKFMSDTLLGGADVKLDGLSSGGQLEEWVPLRTESHGINWFARIRLTLRFELMCLSPERPALEAGGLDELAPSVGLRRIQRLSCIGGMQEDLRKSVSTPDLLSYFESMVS